MTEINTAVDWCLASTKFVDDNLTDALSDLIKEGEFKTNTFIGPVYTNEGVSHSVEICFKRFAAITTGKPVQAPVEPPKNLLTEQQIKDLTQDSIEALFDSEEFREHNDEMAQIYRELGS